MVTLILMLLCAALNTEDGMRYNKRRTEEI